MDDCVVPNAVLMGVAHGRCRPALRMRKSKKPYRVLADGWRGSIYRHAHQPATPSRQHPRRGLRRHQRVLQPRVETRSRRYKRYVFAVQVARANIGSGPFWFIESTTSAYLDGAHNYKNVKAELEPWFERVRPGGIRGAQLPTSRRIQVACLSELPIHSVRTLPYTPYGVEHGKGSDGLAGSQAGVVQTRYNRMVGRNSIPNSKFSYQGRLYAGIVAQRRLRLRSGGHQYESPLGRLGQPAPQALSTEPSQTHRLDLHDIDVVVPCRIQDVYAPIRRISITQSLRVSKNCVCSGSSRVLSVSDRIG